mgnify:CR=1 FL=1
MSKRSVTLAGQALGLSQPLMSQSLSKLRHYFGDPLFVKTSAGMTPTPRAHDMHSQVAEVLRIMRESLEPLPSFDPASSARTFTFVATDFGAALLMARLLPLLARRGPHIRVRAITAPGKEVEDLLESGEADIAYGSFRFSGSSIHQKRIYDADYVCIARAGHPSIDGALTQEMYLHASHALVSPVPCGYEGLENFLLKNIASEKFLMTIPSFLTIITTLPHSDILFTVPRLVGVKLAQLLKAQLLELPVDIPGFTVHQFWHERYHKDPANKWFREIMREMYHA